FVTLLERDHLGGDRLAIAPVALPRLLESPLGPLARRLGLLRPALHRAAFLALGGDPGAALLADLGDGRLCPVLHLPLDDLLDRFGASRPALGLRDALLADPHPLERLVRDAADLIRRLTDRVELDGRLAHVDGVPRTQPRRNLLRAPEGTPPAHRPKIPQIAE